MCQCVTGIAILKILTFCWLNKRAMRLLLINDLIQRFDI